MTETKPPPKMGRKPKKDRSGIKKQRGVTLYPAQWEKLDQTGNASEEIRRILEMNGYPKTLTSKI